MVAKWFMPAFDGAGMIYFCYINRMSVKKTRCKCTIDTIITSSIHLPSPKTDPDELRVLFIDNMTFIQARS